MPNLSTLIPASLLSPEQRLAHRQHKLDKKIALYLSGRILYTNPLQYSHVMQYLDEYKHHEKSKQITKEQKKSLESSFIKGLLPLCSYSIGGLEQYPLARISQLISN